MSDFNETSYLMPDGQWARGEPEASGLADFPDMDLEDQIRILRKEMWEWLVGRRYYSPMSSYSTKDYSQMVREYSQQQLVQKALMIESLCQQLAAGAD